MDLQERDRQMRIKQKTLETNNGLKLCNMLKCFDEANIYNIKFYNNKEYNTQILVVENEETNECYIMFSSNAPNECEKNPLNIESDENCAVFSENQTSFDCYTSVRCNLLEYYNKYFNNIYFVGKNKSYLVNMAIMDCKFHNINTNINKLKLDKGTRAFSHQLVKKIKERFNIAFD